MANITDTINRTPHNYICNDCNGSCCKMYYGALQDSFSFLSQMNFDKDFERKVKNRLVFVYSYISGSNEQESKKEIDSIFNESRGYFFHRRIEKLDKTFREMVKGRYGLKNMRCMFYSKGCIIHEAKPVTCKKHICDILLDSFRSIRTQTASSVY